MTLFGPLPAAAAAPPVDTAPSRTSAPPAKQQAQPPPPAQPTPPPAKTPPPREATALALQRRRPDRAEMPPRPAAIRHRPRRIGQWGRQRWADADEDERDELGHAEAAASTAPHAQPWKGKGKGKAEWEHMQGPRLGPAQPALFTMGWPRTMAPPSTARPANVGLPTAAATARSASPRTARHRGVPACAHRGALGEQPQRRSTALLYGPRHCQMRRQMRV